MRTLPVKEFRRLDLNSEEMGVPVRDLMGNAGHALADAAQDLCGEGSIVILAGKGNNGGDGYAAAAALMAAGRTCTVVAVEPPAGAESQSHAGSLDAESVTPWNQFDTSTEPALIIDCLLGSGIEGAPRPPYDAALQWMRARQDAGCKILACDVPSGMDSEHGVIPDVTVTFHAAKDGMTARNAGRILVVDIGIPRDAEECIGFGDLAVGYPRAAPSSHKGDNGRVVLVAGGPYTGAPYYASVGAYRTGADLVQLYTPADTANHVRQYGPEPIVHDAGPGRHLDAAHVAPIIAALAQASALVIGPGLGEHPDTLAAVERILTAAAAEKIPVVIDADGLDGVPGGYWKDNGHRSVVTPHANEFKDLAGEAASPESAAAWAKKTGATVLLKGAVDTVASPHRTKQCHRGHPTMTVGGTGDVLAGAVGAILSRGAEPFDAAAAAVYAVNVAGELAAKELGPGALALDVADHIPAVLARLG